MICQNQETNACCLQETYFKYKESKRLNVKEFKRTHQAMSKKLKKAGVAIFTSKDFIIRVIVRKNKEIMIIYIISEGYKICSANVERRVMKST